MPNFDHRPPKLMTEVQMHMWGKVMPKRGQPEYLARISTEALGLLASEANHMFVLVLCPYAGMDWRQCPNILFTPDEPTNDRGNISIFFKLI